MDSFPAFVVVSDFMLNVGDIVSMRFGMADRDGKPEPVVAVLVRGTSTPIYFRGAEAEAFHAQIQRLVRTQSGVALPDFDTAKLIAAP